ncbi:YafY family protein [Phenylobacterium sp.]|uniref:helix-turn-helix transcriptional regulator n=1 Tax=Phenylobacterium sp. TaxID=1871053 RepID=UPI00272FD6B1|nr:YafY family protein [Phenylobacterium sp.]MDP1874456.1 YafY family protein [Phenylobacterium sp.]MDP3490023.1 YafY family protein [Phenylobacterium sp.]
MRHEKAAQLLQLARALASTAEGLTLDEMAQEIGVGRRTAERMRDALRDLFPQFEDIEDPPTRRFRIPAGLDALFQTPDAEELGALRAAAEQFRATGARARAAALDRLETKVLSAMRAPARRRLAPDLEAMLQAEAIALSPGPRPFEDDTVLRQVREAIVGLKRLTFAYMGGSTPGRSREVTPLGLLFGRSNYLLAAEGEGGEPRTWRLDRLSDVAVLDRPATPPQDFSLAAFVDRSFGIYQDDVETVRLKVRPHGAEEALGWRFHSTQEVTPQPDGSVLIVFHASGMRELAWHLFSWGDKVEILGPQRLKDMMAEQLSLALAVHQA